MPATEHEQIRAAARASDGFLRAFELGVSGAAMARMEKAGVVGRVVPGVYLGATWPRHGLTEAAAWSLRYPRAVVALLTAGLHHGLTDAFGRGTWLYVPKGSTVPRSRTAALQIVQVAGRLVAPAQDEANGIATVALHGVDVRITGPDRTVLDLWRYPRRIPTEYALTALARRVRARDFELPVFARLARRLGTWSRVEDVIQGMQLR